MLGLMLNQICFNRCNLILGRCAKTTCYCIAAQRVVLDHIYGGNVGAAESGAAATAAPTAAELTTPNKVMLLLLLLMHLKIIKLHGHVQYTVKLTKYSPRHIPNATRSRIECAVTIHALAINPIAWTCTAHIQIDNHTPPWARVYAAISENTSNWTVALLRRTYFSLDSAYLLPNAGNLDCNTVTAHSSKIFQGRLTKQQALMNTDCYQNPHADYSLQTE